MSNKFMKSICLSLAGILTIGSLALSAPVSAMAATRTVTKVTTTTTTTVKSTLVKTIQTASNLTLARGSRTKLAVTIYPAEATNKSVSFSSSDRRIVTVSHNGIIRARHNGKATVFVQSNDGSKTKHIAVTVQPNINPVTSIDPRIRSRFMNIGDRFPIMTSVLPAIATNKNVYYSSSDPSVAMVSKTGVIKAVKKGEAVISVHSSDSGARTVHFRIEVGTTASTFFARVFGK